MPSILVVEHEGRYIERIQDALSAEGWNPRFVAGRPEALRAAASQQPDLVLVNTSLPGAPELLRAFARVQGGPGAVALLAEHERTVEPAEVGADAVLSKPFTDQELRLVVRRGLNRHHEPAPPTGGAAAGAGSGAAGRNAGGDDEPKLTSADIFGDLLAEVEGGEEEPAAETPPQASGGTPQEGPDRPAGPAATPPTPQAPQPPPSQGEPPSPAEPPSRSAAGTGDEDPEIRRRLEQTLSGVFGDERKRRRPEGGDRQPTAAESPAAGSPASGATQPPRRRRPRADADVDELLNLTLSSLESPSRRRRTVAPRSEGQQPAGEREEGAEGARRRTEPLFEDLDLSEIEALADTGRRSSRKGGGPGEAPRSAAPAPEPGTAPEPPAAATPPPAADPDVAGPGTAAPGPRAEDSWADVAQEVERSNEVPPPSDFEPPGLSPSRPAAPAAAEGDDDGSHRFGHYKLMERIAVGGMAEVWKARMSGVEGFQKTVAIKKILPQMTDNADFVSMFIDEAKLAAQLNHPNITHIYDLGKIGRDYYIAMEYVEGPNLRKTLNGARNKGMPLPIGLALLIGARLASALDYAHRKRDFDDRELELVHRDVSPQNVLLSYEGDIKLCDFGIVKAVTKASHTQMGALKGKLQYMSPEQAWGQPVDARSDIFSLGSLLFEMFTGERLFSGDNEISVLELVRECRVRSPRDLNPGVPEAAEQVVLKALAKEPEERYQSSGAMQQELEATLYQLKPTPSQGDLAAWLRRLEEAAELDEGAREAFRWSAGTATGAGAGLAAAPPTDTAAPEAQAPETPTPELQTPQTPAPEIQPPPGAVPAGTEAAPEGAATPSAEPGAEAAGAPSPAAAGEAGAVPAFTGSSTRTGGPATTPPEGPPPASVLPEAGPGGEPEDQDLGVTRPVPTFTDAPELPAPPPLAADDGDGAAGEAAAGETPAGEAVEPEPGADLEVEEGGRRGVWLLVALILLALAAGAAWYFLAGPGAGLVGAPAPAGLEPAVPATAPPGEASTTGPGTGPETGPDVAPEDAAPAGAPAGDAGGTGAAGAAGTEPGAASAAADGEAAPADAEALPETLERLLEEEMARQEEAFQEREQEKQRQLQALQAEVARLRAQAEADRQAAEAAGEEPADGEGGAQDGGDGGP